MFASADDEGTIILWEYRGQTVLSAFQEKLFAGNDASADQKTGGNPFEEAKNEFSEDASQKADMPKKPQVKEDWKSLRTWRGHRRSK
jgi:hypothetical protein